MLERGGRASSSESALLPELKDCFMVMAPNIRPTVVIHLQNQSFASDGSVCDRQGVGR